jgi:hypothetical protein
VALVASAAALALPSLPHAVGLRHAATQVEERADLDSAVDAVVARAGPRSLLAAPHLSAQGQTITPLAWRLHVPAESLRSPRFPGLALADGNQRWNLFRRALRRHHGRVRLRTVTRAWALSLVSVERAPLGHTGVFR